MFFVRQLHTVDAGDKLLRLSFLRCHRGLPTVVSIEFRPCRRRQAEGKPMHLKRRRRIKPRWPSADLTAHALEHFGE